jgi:aspartyl-tRNA synthetase
MQRSLRLRHRVFKATRDYFSDQGFLEIETPFLTKSTPEGARDFLVPSRNQLGSFYALPQSPQLFKQLFMIGGIDRYMQLVKCFRDEDLRHDRQPEFTQLDVEIAFPSEKDQIFAFVEGAMRRVFRDTLSVELQTPFPQLTQAEALARYGTDKPDLRYGMEIHDVSALVADCAFRVFSEAVASGGRVAGIAAKGCAGYSRAAIDRLQQAVVAAGASGLIWLRVQDSITSSIDKFLSEEERSSIVHAFDARAGDLILLVAGEAVEGPLSELRLVIVQQEHPANEEWRFVWVTDFPLFELDDDGRLTSSHHPFTSPRESDVSKLESEPLSVLSNAYDLVLNGTELASGSIRIHSRELQERILAVLGISKRDAELRFGFFLRALDYGAPPHGGFALGMDRLAMLIAGESSLRDVIAFPKTTTGACPLTDAPMPASEAQLNELGIYTHRERA